MVKVATVKLDSGETMKLPLRVVVGEKECPGEAHANANIDNCWCCAPKWGTVPVYAPIDPVTAAAMCGYAVPVNWLDSEEAFKEACANPALRMVGATLKTKRSVSHFMVFIKS